MDMEFVGPGLVVCGEIFHFGLAIVDLWSDANLLLDIQDTQSKYEDNQETIDSVIEANQYTFGECLVPDSISEWENQTTTYCICDQFDVECDGDEFVIEEIQLSQNVSIINSTDVVSTLDEYFEIAKQYVSCTEDENINTWECNKCDCIGDEYNKERSIPLMEAIQEYDALNDTQIQYCDPNTLLDDEYNEYLSNIIIVAWTFLILGSLIQCCAICGRCYLAYIYVEEDVNDDDEGNFIMKLLKMLIAWMVSLFEDVPQTIVVMYYLQFLYADTGYYCHEAFAESPSLQRMSINPRDGILTILFDNPSIAFATAASMVMVVFKGVSVGYYFFKEMSKGAKEQAEYEGFNPSCCIQFCCAGTVVFLIAASYTLMLLMPMAAVSYYDIAPNFHKTWTPAFVIFIAGCVSWGLLCCACCCIALMNAS